jgi:hypothetical protein
VVEQLVCAEIWLILAGLAGLVAYRMLTGRINLSGLIRTRADGPISPAKLQLLVASLGGVLAYVQQFAADPTATGLPEPSNAVLIGLGGSNALHLGALLSDRLDWPSLLRPRP